MVKVDKPKPKTLSKKPALETVSKKKNLDKPTKPAALGKAKADKPAGKQKQKLIKEIVQEAKVVSPVKKQKPVQKTDKAVNGAEPAKKTKKAKNEQKPAQNGTAPKKAPPTATKKATPAAALPTKANKPVKEQKKKNVKPTAAAPATPPPAKRPLILAPSVSPSPLKLAPPAPTAAGKNKKQNKKKPPTAAAQEIKKTPQAESTKAPKPTVAASKPASAAKPASTVKPTKAGKQPNAVAGAVKPGKQPNAVAGAVKPGKANKKAAKGAKGKKAGPHTREQTTHFHKKQFKTALKAKNAKKELKKKTPQQQQAHVFEALPFDEDKFKCIVNADNIEKVAVALKTQVEEEVAKQKTSIFSDYRYFLNVAYVKIPSVPKRMVKLSLKHSLVDKDDDAVIIVPDLQRGAKADYDPTIAHYTDIFREAGVDIKLKIMPFNQLRTECNTFEAMRKFSNSYEYYMCDGRVIGHVTGMCGKIFQKPRCAIHSVRLDNPKTIKTEIEKSLRRTAYRQLQKGNLISLPVGNHKFSARQLAENVEHAVEQLKALVAGGLGNVRNMHLRIDILGTSSLPIYMSMAQPPETTPYVTGPREERMLKMKKDANEVLSRFALTKDADMVKLSRKQAEKKRKLQEMRASLMAADSAAAVAAVEGEAEAVPAKKARTVENGKAEKGKKQKAAAKVAEVPEQEEGDDDNEDEDDDDDAAGSDEDADEADSDEDDDDDDEE